MTDLRALARYRFEGKSEQAVREEWVHPLLVHLGYGIETLNEVRYETQLKLAAPFRRIGRDKVKVDYVPTVLGHGLWIIEGKAHGRDDWEQAISQGWLYATHPEIDVAFMVIADGSRIAVYDVNEPDWQNPVVDIATPELASRFPELAAVLGAANVTRTIRRRRMRHLGAAMKAELDGARLQEYVAEIQQLAREAQSAVGENARAILRDQLKRENSQRQETVSAVGLFAIGVWMNQPFALSAQWAELGLGHVKSLPAEQRAGELQRLLDAGTYPGPPDGVRRPRMFWMLRWTALELYLALRDDEGCGEQARDLARLPCATTCSTSPTTR
jgi:hypothetical protein